MNKIKQNKITFTLILLAIAIIFSSLTILSLPVLFNYKSKVELIEKIFIRILKFTSIHQIKFHLSHFQNHTSW